MKKLSSAQLGRIDGLFSELRRIAVDGTRDPDEVQSGLQELVDGRRPRGLLIAEAHQEYEMAGGTPSWWRTAEQQLERARQLWPNIGLPAPPEEFTPQTASEVLLLHVPDTFDALWRKVDAPEGYTKERWMDVKSSERYLRLAPNKHVFTEPVWLAFDPEYGKGLRPASLQGQANLAASEVLSALTQFPAWSLSWYDNTSAPNLSGYQLKCNGNWRYVPCFRRWDKERLMKLTTNGDNYADRRWASPSVRVC